MRASFHAWCFVFVFALADAPSALAQSRSIEDLAAPSNPYTIVAWISPGHTPDECFVAVAFDLSPGHYLYALTQTGGLATTLEVAVDNQMRIAGPFYSSEPPQRVARDPLLNIPVEKHTGRIVFYLPLTISGHWQPNELSIPIRVNGQVCSANGMCIPIRNRVMEARWLPSM